MKIRYNRLVLVVVAVFECLNNKARLMWYCTVCKHLALFPLMISNVPSLCLNYYPAMTNRFRVKHLSRVT